MNDRSSVPAPKKSDFAKFAAGTRRLGAVGPLALIAASLPAIGGFVLLGFMGTIGSWLVSHGTTMGVLIYITGFAVLAGLALLPTYAQAVLGGWAFGFAVGFPAALVGFLGGAVIGGAIARRAAGDRVMEVIREKPRWLAVRDALIGAGRVKSLGVVTLVRIPPNSPFALVNLLLSSVRVAWMPYVLGTLLGLAPRTAAAVYIGQNIKDLAHPGERPTWLVVGGIVVAVLVVLILGVMANKAIAGVTRPTGPSRGQA